MKLVLRPLTEMLEVRILPGEPNLFDLKKLQSLGRAFGSRPNAWAFEINSSIVNVDETGDFFAVRPTWTSAVIKT